MGQTATRVMTKRGGEPQTPGPKRVRQMTLDMFGGAGGAVTEKAEEAAADADASVHASASVSASVSASAPASALAFDTTAFQATLDDTTVALLHDALAMDPTWMAHLHSELTKPYFLTLQRFLQAARKAHTVYPPAADVYSWSTLTPFSNLKVLILGQDPYHGPNQAHGLAFLVQPGVRPPPSLVNIYKNLKLNYPQFEIPDFKTNKAAGNLVPWAEQGVLMLNACLTVEAHKANSHAGRGWEEFTAKVVEVVLRHSPGVVCMLWGLPAQKNFANVVKKAGLAGVMKNHLVLKLVHPSPLSASRGWFDQRHFLEANEWLGADRQVEWGLAAGNHVLG